MCQLSINTALLFRQGTVALSDLRPWKPPDERLSNLLEIVAGHKFDRYACCVVFGTDVQRDTRIDRRTNFASMSATDSRNDRRDH